MLVPKRSGPYALGLFMIGLGQRRSDRLFAQIRIRVAGADSSGIWFEEETTTVNINQHGGCISLTHTVSPDTTLSIRNLQNGIESQFRVVGDVHQVFGNRGEYGVENLNPDSGIWGVDFTPPPEGVQAKVLIECEKCKGVALAPFLPLAFEVLLHTGRVSRFCHPCDETTRWRPSKTPLGAELATVRGKPSPQALERRSFLRRDLTMQLRVRTCQGTTEIVQTVDVAKSGVCFVGKGQYKIGEEIHVALPSDARQPAVETKARIIWSRECSLGRLYGVCYVK